MGMSIVFSLKANFIPKSSSFAKAAILSMFSWIGKSAL